MWSPATFAHVRQAADELERAVAALQFVLSHGPDIADPATVHEAGQVCEAAMERLWAPIAWDAPCEP